MQPIPQGTSARSSKVPPLDLKKIERGDTIIYVQDTFLAAALVQVGIPLRQDPSHVIKVEGGRRIGIFNFASRSHDGAMQTIALLAAWKNPVKWLEKFPSAGSSVHPWTPFVEWKLNYDAMLAKVRDEIPFLVFKPSEASKAVCNVRQGSKHEAQARTLGWKQL